MWGLKCDQTGPLYSGALPWSYHCGSSAGFRADGLRRRGDAWRCHFLHNDGRRVLYFHAFLVVNEEAPPVSGRPGGASSLAHRPRRCWTSLSVSALLIPLDLASVSLSQNGTLRTHISRVLIAERQIEDHRLMLSFIARNAASGSRSTISSRAKAGPAGYRRCCSQLRSVAGLTLIARANTSWLMPSRCRIAFTSGTETSTLCVVARDVSPWA
jgi:hypothetical protein